MKTLVFILLALLSAVLLGVLADSSSGYLVITIADWIIGASVTFSAIFLFIVFILLYLLLRFINKIIALPNHFRKWRTYRRQHKAEKHLIQGMITLTEGEWKQAENEFLRAASYSRSPQVNYLLAARAAQKQAVLNRRDNYLHLAHQNDSNTALAAGITQAKLQLSCQQNEQALATLQALHAKQPEHAEVTRLLLDACDRLGEWDLMLSALTQFKHNRALDKEGMLARQIDAYAGLLIAASNKGDLTEVNRIWHAIPSKLSRQSYLIDVYVTQRIRLGNAADCDKLLLTALKHNWDRALVRLYGVITSDDHTARLTRMEQFIKDHPRDSALLLTLGRLSIKNELWGKAKNYLKASIAEERDPAACYELAALYEREENKEAAIEYYETGLALATNRGEYRQDKHAVG